MHADEPARNVHKGALSMPPSSKYFDIKFDKPATYRITVQGQIHEHYSECFGGMRFTTSPGTDHTTVTILTGRLSDQAELAGILNSLYELHLPIRTVTLIKEDE